MSILSKIARITLREFRIHGKNHIYIFCTVIFPLFLIFFFTNFLGQGLPTNMPAGIVDMDNTSTTRRLIRMLDSYQSSEVVAHYPTVNEARQAMQRGDIYAFFYFPKGTTEELLASRQPKISFYYNNSFLLAGSLMYKDMRVVATRAAAGVGLAKMQAQGYTEDQIMAFLQPIVVDTHPTINPYLNYNFYLSTTIIPGCLMLFIFLITAYSIGTELKFGKSKEWMAMADNNIHIAMLGKLLPQFVVHLIIVLIYLVYTFEILQFPHACSFWQLIPYGILLVAVSQAFGVFVFGLMPSLRMSMSICALWAMLSFTISGFAFPLDAMDPQIQALSWLFPLRSFFMIYQMTLFNGYPTSYAWIYYVVLMIFLALPFFVLPNIKKAMLKFVYIP
ncbi:MAG: ABC transporter permease [Bacteroidaceae bacterium]|nr:ABC transporter permease [Bacteroidaceae bacterium]